MFKGIIEALIAFFKFGESANKVAEKALPSEKIQEGKFEIKHERLETEERTKIYNRIATHLQMHPRENIDAYVDVICTDMNVEDKEEIRIALHKRFQNREDKKMKIKNKTI